MPTPATTHFRRAPHAAAATAPGIAPAPSAPPAPPAGGPPPPAPPAGGPAGAASAPPAAGAGAPPPRAPAPRAVSPPPPATPAAAAPAKVCVVDTGVDITTDAAGAVIERYSEFGGTVDDTGAGTVHKHGTYVAGMIASQLDNRGTVGIWPQARIISDRVFDSGTSTTVATYLDALTRCIDRGARVVNLSLSGLSTATGPELDQLDNRIGDLRTNYGINVVAAAGNNGAE